MARMLRSFAAVFALVTGAWTGLCAPGGAAAQGFPAKPVKVVIPFAAGGSYDVVARLIGQKFQESTGQALVLDNRAGAGGLIAGEFVAKAPPDGYTILMAAAGQVTIAPALQPTMPYDPLVDLLPVTHLLDTPMVLVVRSDAPVGSVAEFIARAKARPGALSYGSAGNGSVAHLLMELFRQSTAIDMVHVPYRGIAPALNDVVGGDLFGAFTTIASAKPHLDGNRLKPLALASPRRTVALKEVPTTAEAGIANVDIPVWMGMLAPKGTPDEIVQRLHAEFTKALTAPDMNERMVPLGAEVVAGGPQQFGAMLRDDTARWRAVVRAGNIKIE